MHKRAMPFEVMKYKHVLELYKLYNNEKQSEDWIDLKTEQAFNDRVQTIKVFDNSRLKIGKNLLLNRMTILNNELNYDLMNVSYNSFKVKCKEKFLKWGQGIQKFNKI